MKEFISIVICKSLRHSSFKDFLFYKFNFYLPKNPKEIKNKKIGGILCQN